MTRVELSKLARRQLNIIARRRTDTDAVIDDAARGVGQLSDHPESGQQLGGRYRGYRILAVGRQPILLIYRYDEADDRVVIAAVLDGRDRRAPQP